MTNFDGKTVNFDPHDLRGNVALMDRADEFDVPFFGSNEDGEHIMISVNSDNITVQTFQKNGWCRENIYYRDGICEELFSK